MTPYGYPELLYHVLLDEQPYYLVPPRLFGAHAEAAAFVNPSCWFSWQGEPPPALAPRINLPDRFLSWPCIVWVDDPTTRSAWPYWLGHEFVRYFEGARPGQPLPAAIPPHAVWVLRHAKILVGDAEAAQDRCLPAHRNSAAAMSRSTGWCHRSTSARCGATTARICAPARSAWATNRSAAAISPIMNRWPPMCTAN